MDPTIVETVHGRANPLVDPTLSVWGWEIPVYLFLGGLAAGLMILPAALELARGRRPDSVWVRLGPLLAAALLSLGMGALFLDLEHKLYVWRFYLAFKPASPMSWGAWILVLVYPVAFLAWWDPAWLPRRAVLWTAVAAGGALGIYTGILLGAMAARPGWNSAVLGPLFLASGLSTGAALLLLLPLDARDRHALVRIDAVALVAEAALLGVLLIGFASGDRTAHLAFEHLTTRNWASAFWSLVVVAGISVPLAFEALEIRRKLAFVAVAPVLVLVGGLSLRFVLVLSGQASSFDEFPG
ncbi:MAG: polysulfide reductase NrfD [Deltaproteobacteria bacterium]|nr:polysulfide reductase NrfD [Deltaproteobacteria bacterium]